MTVRRDKLWNRGKMKGGLRQRGLASWELALPLGGSKKRFVTFNAANLRAAQKERTRLLSEIEGGGIEPARITTGQYLTAFLRDTASVRVRARTLKGYSSVVRARLIPHLGNVPLGKLSASHVAAMLTALRAEGARLDTRGNTLSPYSIAATYRVLRLALNAAVKQGLLRYNPLRQLDVPKIPRQEMRALDRAEVQKLIEAAAEHEIRPVVILLIHTGLRRSEVCGLQWGDIDLTLGTLTVARGLHVLRRGERLYEPPKSRAGRRLIALSPTAALMLRTHRERMEARAATLGTTLTDHMPVFSRPDSTPMAPDTMSHQFSKIAEKAGLGKIGLHTLRHTHASLMLQAGIHPKIVQERLGHSSIQVTLDTYSHVMPGIQQAAALTFDASLRGEETARREPVPTG